MNKLNINQLPPQLSLSDQLNGNLQQQSPQHESTTSKRPIIVRATHEYVPVNNDELHIHVNDLITITNLEEGGWWEGTLHTRTGWFPSNYVVVMDEVQQDGGCCDDGVGGERLVTMPTNVNQSDEYKRMIVSELIESEVKFIGEMEEFGERVLGGVCSLNNSGTTTEPQPIVSTLKQAYNAIIQTHKTSLLATLQSHTSSSFDDLRVGRIFMTAAPALESAHTRYCSYHPRFVQFVEGNREVFERGCCDGDSSDEMNPVLRVIMCLSAPFRRVERYGNVLSELDCHVEGFHGDKGELRRGVMYFRGLEKTLTSLRKQKEMELEVLTPGQIKEFEGPEISTLGEIILMGLMYVVGSGGERLPRYFVLFPTTILILAYDTADSSFTYKGRVSVAGVTVLNGRGSGSESGDEEVGFEIAGPTLHPIVIQCPSARVKQLWLQSLNDVIRTTRCYSSPFGQQQQQQSSNVQQPTPTTTTTSTLLLPPPQPQTQSPSQQNNPLTPPVLQAWNITRLRPSPPYNPFLAEYYSRGSLSQQQQKLDRGGFGRSSSSGGSSSRSVSLVGKTGSFAGFGGFSAVGGGGSGSVSNEEDFAVLSIVDGFCVRGISGSGGGLLRNDPSNRSLRSLQEYNLQQKNSRPPTSLPVVLLQQQQKPLPQLVKLLHDDIKALHERIGSLTRQLDEERVARGQLVGLMMRVVEQQ